jgi:hypothetical protein
MDWHHIYNWHLQTKARYISLHRTDLPSRRSEAIYGRDTECKSYDTLLFYIDSTAKAPLEVIKTLVMETGRFLRGSGFPATKAYVCLFGDNGAFVCGAEAPFTTQNSRPFLPVYEKIQNFCANQPQTAGEAKAPEMLRKFFRHNALVVVIGRKDNLPADEYFKEFKGHVHIFNVNGSEIDGYYIWSGGSLETIKVEEPPSS